MNKEQLLQSFLQRVDDIKDNRKKKLLKSILKNENWYNEVNIDTFYSILLDLNYSKEDIKKIYISLKTIQ